MQPRISRINTNTKILFVKIRVIRGRKMTGSLRKWRDVRIFRGEVLIFLAALALATDEPPLSVASAKAAGIAGACFHKITASERKVTVFWYICFLHGHPNPHQRQNRAHDRIAC